MSENERVYPSDNDIWVKGIKTICGHHKKALLDYVDALERKMNQQESNCLGMIKAKIHNDLSQIQLMIGILFETHRSGGSIKPFEDSFSRASHKDRKEYKSAAKVGNERVVAGRQG
jgi:hypothetical protein